MATLSADDLRTALDTLANWHGDAGAISCTYRFESFSQAIGFMVRAAMVAEKADHHPEWTNVYDRVEVRLTTHDAGGVTMKDVALARAMDTIAGA